MAQETVELIKKTESEAEKVVANAQEQATEIKAQAKSEAQKLLVDAKQKAVDYVKELADLSKQKATTFMQSAEEEALKQSDAIVMVANEKRDAAVKKCAEQLLK